MRYKDEKAMFIKSVKQKRGATLERAGRAFLNLNSRGDSSVHPGWRRQSGVRVWARVRWTPVRYEHKKTAGAKKNTGNTHQPTARGNSGPSPYSRPKKDTLGQ